MRFKLPVNAEVLLEGKEKSSLRMQLIDFSREGLRFLIPQIVFFKKGLLTLKIYLPNSDVPISIQGGIRWMQPASGLWEVGMRIEKIRPADKIDILDYAYKIWKKKEKKIEI